jgi:hypothetical protein
LCRVGLIGSVLLFSGFSRDFAATLSLAWSSGPEADIAGYRLRYGTTPGAPTSAIDSGGLTQCAVSGLATGVPYYFSLVAYDASGNESAPSPEIEAVLPGSGAPPALEAVIETTTDSMFVLRGTLPLLRLVGSNLQSGARVSFGSGISTFSVSLAGGDLSVRAGVPAWAAPGPRTTVVTNPDGGMASAMGLITIVRTPDINADCRVDAFDLNELARAWNRSSGEVAYTDVIDFDGDGTVGPDDLTIFVKFFSRPLPGCP